MYGLKPRKDFSGIPHAPEEQSRHDASSKSNEAIPVNSFPPNELSFSPTDGCLDAGDGRLFPEAWSLDEPSQGMNDYLMIGQSPNRSFYERNATFAGHGSGLAIRGAFSSSVSH